MKKLWIGILLLTMATAVCAQNRNINFTTSSLQDAFKLAKEQHKMIFTDCYTVWCVPCKGMDRLVFNQDSVADFFNSHFINVKMDMEKGEGPAALKTYNVGAFPTYLLFDENGNQVYKFVGGMSAAEFMAKIRIGMKVDNRESKMLASYAAGQRTADLMRELILLKLRQMELEGAKKLNDELMDMLTPVQRALPENWVLFKQNRYAMYLSNVDSRNFNYLADHWRDFAPTNNKDSVDQKMSFIFRKLSTESLEGYHFKKRPYNKAEFERYKKQIRGTEMPDKKQLLVLVEMGQAAGEKNPEKVTALFEKNIPTFSEDHLRITWGYLSYCASIPGYKYSRATEIADKIIKQTKNPYLVSICNMLKAKQVRANQPAIKKQDK